MWKLIWDVSSRLVCNLDCVCVCVCVCVLFYLGNFFYRLIPLTVISIEKENKMPGFLVAQLVKNAPAILCLVRTWFDSWVRKIPWRRDRLPTSVFLGFPGGSDGKESACNAGDLGSIPGLGRSPGGGHGDPLQYSHLETPQDTGAWQTTVDVVAKGQT